MKKVKSLARVTSDTSPRSSFPGYSPIIDIGIVIVLRTPSITASYFLTLKEFPLRMTLFSLAVHFILADKVVDRAVDTLFDKIFKR